MGFNYHRRPTKTMMNFKGGEKQSSGLINWNENGNIKVVVIFIEFKSFQNETDGF